MDPYAPPGVGEPRPPAHGHVATTPPGRIGGRRRWRGLPALVGLLVAALAVTGAVVLGRVAGQDGERGGNDLTEPGGDRDAPPDGTAPGGEGGGPGGDRADDDAADRAAGVGGDGDGHELSLTPEQEALVRDGFVALEATDGGPVVAHRFDPEGWWRRGAGRYESYEGEAVMVLDVVPVPVDGAEPATLSTLATDHVRERGPALGTGGLSEVVAAGLTPTGSPGVVVAHEPGPRVLEALTVALVSGDHVVMTTVLLREEVAREEYEQMVVSAQDVRR